MEKSHWVEPSYHLTDDVPGKQDNVRLQEIKRSDDYSWCDASSYLWSLQPGTAGPEPPDQTNTEQLKTTHSGSWLGKPATSEPCPPARTATVKCCHLLLEHIQIKNIYITHTTEVLLRMSALKMLSSKLKKLTAISSTTTGPA